MTKSEFLSILANGLKDFPDRELADIIFDYQEHFVSGFSNGKTEDEIINELGDPKELVDKYRSDYLEGVEYKNIKNNNINSFENNFNDINNTAPFYEDVISESLTDSEEIHDDSTENTSTNSYDNNSSSSNNDFTKESNNKRKKGIFRNFSFNAGGLLKILLIGLLLLVSFPIIFAIGGFSLAIFIGFVAVLIAIVAICIGINIFGISILLAKVGLVVLGASNTPSFIMDFPTSSIVLFVIGSIALALLFIMLTYYFLKFGLFYAIKIIKKIFGKEAN